MPPKKQAEDNSQKLLWGRPGNGLKMGIVGLPNVGKNIYLGKSTTFNLMSKLSVPSENYPFCTIDPNNARVAVPDARFDHLC
jgi:obg-like ATPase 1